MTWPLYPQGESLWYPLDRRLGEPQSRSGRRAEEKNSQVLPGHKPPIIQPVAQPPIISSLVSHYKVKYIATVFV